MIALTSELWKYLDTPYGTAEEIPDSIRQLQANPNQDLANNLIFDYLYHQGSVYTCTLASFPYLMAILENCYENTGVTNEGENLSFIFDLMLSMGTLAVSITRHFDGGFRGRSAPLSVDVQQQLIQDYQQTFQRFKKFVCAFSNHHSIAETVDGEFYLSTFLLCHDRLKEAEIFQVHTLNEMVFICPSCQLELYLEAVETVNEQSKQPKIILKVTDTVDGILNEDELGKFIFSPNLRTSTELAWLAKAVDILQFTEFKKILPYLRGSLHCSCGCDSNVWAGVMKSYE